MARASGASQMPAQAERSVDARSHLPAAAQLASWAEEKDWTAVAEFAEDLAQRRDQLWDRGRDVATREQELAQRSPGIATEGAVPVAAADHEPSYPASDSPPPSSSSRPS